jgi:hypothetical protein
LIVFAVVLAVLAVGCMPDFGPDRVVDDEYVVTKGDTLTVTSDVGSIDIDSWSGDTMSVTARIKRTSWLFSHTDPEEVEIVVDTSNGITVWALPENRRGVSVSFEILVPATVNIERLRTDVGSITLTDVYADGTIETSTGSIEARNVEGFPELISDTGSIESIGGSGVRSATTDTGSIEVEFRGLPSTSQVPLRADTGGIDVWILPGLDADIFGETNTGSVSVESDLDFSGIEHDDLIDGRVGLGGGAGEPEIHAQTSTGSVGFHGL